MHNRKQNDWVPKLPAIEFAINSAGSDNGEYRLCTELWTCAAATSSIWKLELSTAERVPVYSEPRLAEEFSTYECTPAHLLPEPSRLMTQTESASYRRSNRTYKSIWDWSHFPSPDPPRKLSSALNIFSPSSSIVSHTFHIPQGGSGI